MRMIISLFPLAMIPVPWTLKVFLYFPLHFQFGNNYEKKKLISAELWLLLFVFCKYILRLFMLLQFGYAEQEDLVRSLESSLAQQSLLWRVISLLCNRFLYCFPSQFIISYILFLFFSGLLNCRACLLAYFSATWCFLYTQFITRPFFHGNWYLLH